MGTLEGLAADWGRAVTQREVSKAKTKAPEQTFEEVKYLRHLIDNHSRCASV